MHTRISWLLSRTAGLAIGLLYSTRTLLYVFCLDPARQQQTENVPGLESLSTQASDDRMACIDVKGQRYDQGS